MLRLALCAALALGCTTSFDLADLPLRDAGRASLDAATCGEEGLPCCDDAGPRCAPGAVCSEGRCQRCPGTTSACGGACVDTQTNLTHCGGCDRPCPQGQSCAAGSCMLACPSPLAGCGGACVDLTRNTAHCGACDRRCAAGEVCAAGTCMTVCAPGEERCGGACVDVARDPRNCGRCGTVCPASAGTARCVGGRCEAPGCMAGFADCDGNTANGCETPLSGIANCGRCGRRCDVPNATARCSDGACVVGVCGDGFANCDGSDGNGCEVNTTSDTENCGRCGNRCPVPPSGRAVCINGQCGASTLTCRAGTADCDGMSFNMCEATLPSIEHCARCGDRCFVANGVPSCAMGGGGFVCGLARCTPPYRNCDDMLSNGCETDITSSVAHCGGCNTACAAPNGTPACVNGMCAVASCMEGYGDCDGRADNGCETDTSASATHCGRCNNRCVAAGGTPACAAGRCVVASCEAGRANCDNNAGNGCETDTRSDIANCGACGVACVLPNATPRCDGGRCGVARCNDGFGDCDMNPANGRETDLRTTPAHCGSCGNACRAPANSAVACVAGACGGSCLAGWGNCDGNVSNGCETRTVCNAFHCGRCGNRCPLGQGCCNGQCQFLAGVACVINGVECR